MTAAKIAGLVGGGVVAFILLITVVLAFAGLVQGTLIFLILAKAFGVGSVLGVSTSWFHCFLAGAALALIGI